MRKHNHNLVLRSDKIQKAKDKARFFKEEVALFRSCQKFNTTTKKDEKILSPKQAIVFLNLRAHDCNRHDAKVFSQRNLCKWDSTQKHDGPASCRILKPSPINKAMIAGWQNAGSEVPYELPIDFENDLRKVCLEDSRDKQIQEDFDNNEARIKGDFKAKIKILGEFYQSLNEKYNFDLKKLGSKGLTEQLQSIKQQYRDTREKPLRYMKYKGVKFLHILEEIDDTQVVDNVTPIQQLKAFSKLINVKPNQLQFKEKFADDLFFHLHPEESNSKRQEHKGELFHRFANQSKAVINLVDSKGVSQSLGGRVKGISLTDNQISAQNKDMFASDFNQSQYMFKVKEVVSTQKQIRMNKVRKIMARIDEGSPTSPRPKQPSVFIKDSMKSTETNSRNPSFIKGRMKLVKGEKKRGSRSNDLNESQDTLQSQQMEKERRFQIMMKNFIRHNILKINPPRNDNFVDADNLPRESYERQKIYKPSQPQQHKKKLSLDLFRGNLNLDIPKSKSTLPRAETTRESKLNQRKFFRRTTQEQTNSSIA